MAVEPGGIGARLRAAREKLGLTVLQVAERMHTDPKIVEAIEADNYEALGAPVYARGHIRHYAELVGESATELIGLYSDRSQVAQPDLTRIVKAPSGSHTNKLVAPALVVIAVFAVAGAVWWVSSLSKKKPQLAETHVVGDESPATASTPGQPLPQAPGAESPPVASGSPGPSVTVPARPPAAMAMQPRPQASATPQRTAAPAAPPAGPTPNPSRSGGASAPATAATAPATTATAGASAAAAALPPRSKNQAQVTLRYSADSWTEVYDASGARLYYDVGSANSVQTVVGTPPLRVVLGNAAGVAVEFNGHNTPIAKLSHPDGSVQFSINRSGRVVRAKPSADGG